MSDTQKNSNLFKRILRSSFKHSSWKVLVKFLLSSISSIIGIALACKNFLNFSVEKSTLYGFVSVVILFTLWFFIRAITTFARYLTHLRDQNIYGRAFIRVQDIISKNLWLNSIATHDDKLFKSILEHNCKKLKEVFDTTTKKNCSVSFKVAYGENVNSDTAVVNLARNPESHKRNTEKYLNEKHRIFKNTCFNEILLSLTDGSNQFFYINNNIKETANYRNTSKKVNDGELPYNSEIVVPIIRYYPSETAQKLIGFLCVDCPKEDVFNEHYDVAILQMVADSIYESVKRYQDWLTQQNQSTNSSNSTN